MCSLTRGSGGLLDPLRTRLPLGLRKRERAARDESPARRAVGERARASEGDVPGLVGVLAQELADLIVLGRVARAGEALARGFGDLEAPPRRPDKAAAGRPGEEPDDAQKLIGEV